jgi:hypothetical protein
LLKVADFGITGQGTSATNLDSHFSVGTAVFHAPELVGGCNTADIHLKDEWGDVLGGFRKVISDILVKDEALIDGYYGAMNQMMESAVEGNKVSMEVPFLHFSWLIFRNKDWKQRVEHGPPTFVNISLLALKHLVL